MTMTEWKDTAGWFVVPQTASDSRVVPCSMRVVVVVSWDDRLLFRVVVVVVVVEAVAMLLLPWCKSSLPWYK